MTNEVQTASSEVTLSALRNRAKELGLVYNSTSTIKQLQSAINEYEKNALFINLQNSLRTAKAKNPNAPKYDSSLVEASKKYALRKIRVIITPLNPNEQNATGGIMTFANDIISVTCVFPYGVVWFVEYAVLEQLKRHKYLVLGTSQDRVGNSAIDPQKKKYMPSYHIEELPPLTEAELKALAEMQRTNNTGQAEY